MQRMPQTAPHHAGAQLEREPAVREACCIWNGVRGSLLDIAQRHTSIEGGGYERVSQRVRPDLLGDPGAASHPPHDPAGAVPRVGQLLMVDCPSTAVSSTTVSAIHTYHVGSVILDGTSTLGISQQRSITTALQARVPAHTKLFISTDQEGGLVRRMRGPGFASIPTALVQGGWSASTLQSRATTWAGQLRSAGINVDLAPVLDTVPAGDTNNPPIGELDREYGHYPSVVTPHGLALARGLAAAGVIATVKHFPGLGRVTANTDTTRGVTDSTTTSTDSYLRPFAAAIQAGVPFVMMSTAIYTRIDPSAPAAFSPRIVTGLLRDTLGFHGVVISDDLGAAPQISGYSVGSRAWRFIDAGGDIVLTVNATQAAPMTGAILSRMHTNATFKKKVYAAALRVLTAKQAHGLLP
jgi:beta-N-acetylhexosaminidase